MIALFSFLIIIFLSLFVVRIGSIALEATGVSKDISQFESLSAFSGVGFTTKEAEIIMGSGLRRRIIKVLMILGSAGLTTGVATLILTFISDSQQRTMLGFSINSFTFNFSIIIFGSFTLFLISKSKSFDHFVRFCFKGPFRAIKKKVSLYDYENLLGMSKGYGITQFQVPKKNWMSNETIGTLKLEKEGINVLGVFRSIHGHEEYIGLPSNDFTIHYKDKIIIYCRDEIVQSLANRPKGKKGTELRKESEIQHKKINLVNQLDEKKFALANKQEDTKKKTRKKKKIN
ncbi:TrkA C-terminal domain-containing protein [Candidatus Woesearchaeota archaeon]|nr:TrkA C-terminal domain-containing protein [Candidatus Woesearchaeota archaeon]